MRLGKGLEAEERKGNAYAEAVNASALPAVNTSLKDDLPIDGKDVPFVERGGAAARCPPSAMVFPEPDGDPERTFFICC